MRILKRGGFENEQSGSDHLRHLLGDPDSMRIPPRDSYGVTRSEEFGLIIKPGYDIIVLGEVIDLRAFDVVREVISPDLLTDFQIRQWVQIPKFASEILEAKDKLANFGGTNVLFIMRRCLRDMNSSGFVDEKQIAVLERACKTLERKYKQLRNFDEFHWEIKRNTKMLHREISIWEQVPQFKNDLCELKRNGIGFSDQKVLQVMRHILELHPAASEISGVNTEMLRNAAVRVSERIKETEDGMVG